MNLKIDTSSSEKIILNLDGEVFESDAKQNKSQRLLPFIEEVLLAKNKSIKDISSIEVVTGPGSFTGLRVGGAVAQAIAWIENIPLNGEDINIKKFIKINY